MTNLEAAAKLIELVAAHDRYSGENYSEAVALAISALSRVADIQGGAQDG